MNNKLLISIVILAGFALAGIIYVQLYFIRTAIIQNEISFDQKVNDALRTFVEKLEQKETVEIIYEQVKKNKKARNILKHNNPIPNAEKKFVFEFNDSMLNKMVFISEMDHATVDVKLVDSNLVINNGIKIQSKHTIKTIKKKDGTQIIHQSWTNAEDTLIFIDQDGLNTHFSYTPDTTNVFVVKKDKLKAKTEMVKDVYQKMEDENKEQIRLFRKELNSNLVDSLLSVSLKERDILLPYEYLIQSPPKENKNNPVSIGFDSLNVQKKYAIGLFPNDIIPKPDKIILYFPNRKEHLLKSLSFLLPSSLLFSLIVIVAFSISISMVVRQKKISDIKTDFINNMTHEFKTPIATISLAADTIINPKVISDHEKINQFIRIIKDENKRMNTQVERILQMAQLERKELDLKLEWIDIHQLINKTIENITVQIRQLNGLISTEFAAIKTELLIDEVHFTNVINNLLDNAIKYTVNQPIIKIYTSQLENGISISFEDKGIGMSKEAQSKIFDKFYRVSKGNIHNVKGFGLGLSYVKAIIEAHGGRISVWSELNKGSRFDIFLPQNKKENGKSA